MTNTKVYLAVYKGTKDGKGANIQLVRLTDWAIRKITRGAYSHCEIAVNLGGKCVIGNKLNHNHKMNRWQHLNLPL